MEKIKSITEAFAHQPISLQVGSVAHHSTDTITSIELETINFPVAGDPFEYWFYIGRDINGKKLFQYRAETVNVHYF